MSDTAALILFYVIVAFGAAYIGYSLRRRIDKRKETRLIKELESLLGQELPRYKKEKHQGQINWDRVYNLLKKEPKTDQVLRLREEVEKQIHLHYSTRARIRKRR